MILLLTGTNGTVNQGAHPAAYAAIRYAVRQGYKNVVVDEQYFYMYMKPLKTAFDTIVVYGTKQDDKSVIWDSNKNRIRDKYPNAVFLGPQATTLRMGADKESLQVVQYKSPVMDSAKHNGNAVMIPLIRPYDTLLEKFKRTRSTVDNEGYMTRSIFTYEPPKKKVKKVESEVSFIESIALIKKG